MQSNVNHHTINIIVGDKIVYNIFCSCNNIIIERQENQELEYIMLLSHQSIIHIQLITHI